MIVGYESVFEKALKERLEDLLTARRYQLEGGYPADFPAYRELVGYLKALKDISAAIKDVNDSMSNDEER